MVDTMTKLRNIIGAKEFEDRVKTKLKQVDENINENDLYFYKTVTGYCMIYKPKYPERSNGDFIVYQDLNGSISVHGNMDAIVPTIDAYEDIEDFEKNMDNRIQFTQGELQLLYAACMSYGDKLSEIIKSIPNEETEKLSDRVKDSWNLAIKITKYMEG